MTAPIITFGDVDEATMRQAENCASTGPVVKVGLMADNHKGYGVPIGGVVVYDGAVSPSGVGYDIACGVKAVRTNLKYGRDLHPDNRLELLQEIKANIAFGIGRESKLDKSSSPVLENPLWGIVPREILSLKRMAEQQLGSVGSGNHYIDLLVDRDDVLWVAAHFGSRGFGHKTATHFLKALGAKDDMDSAPAVITNDNPLYADYMTSMRLAGDYAYAGRDLVVDKVLEILGAEARDDVHNHHNFAWAETFEGEERVVVRKGATPAYPGQRGFVGGSMGDFAAIVKGTESSTLSLNSTVHGAGRLMSRTAAKGKIRYNKTTGETRVIAEPRISQFAHDEHIERFDVVVLGGELDESPFAYRRLHDVVEAQGDTIEVEAWLKPVAVAMAGGDEYDPYRD